MAISQNQQISFSFSFFPETQLPPCHLLAQAQMNLWVNTNIRYNQPSCWNTSRQHRDPFSWPLLSTRPCCFHLFAPDNTAGIVLQLHFPLIKSFRTMEVFSTRGKRDAFIAAALLETQEYYPKQTITGCWCNGTYTTVHC